MLGNNSPACFPAHWHVAPRSLAHELSMIWDLSTHLRAQAGQISEVGAGFTGRGQTFEQFVAASVLPDPLIRLGGREGASAQRPPGAVARGVPELPLVPLAARKVLLALAVLRVEAPLAGVGHAVGRPRAHTPPTRPGCPRAPPRRPVYAQERLVRLAAPPSRPRRGRARVSYAVPPKAPCHERNARRQRSLRAAHRGGAVRARSLRASCGRRERWSATRRAPCSL